MNEFYAAKLLVQRDTRLYTLDIPLGAPYAEALLVLNEFNQRIIKMSENAQKQTQTKDSQETNVEPATTPKTEGQAHG